MNFVSWAFALLLLSVMIARVVLGRNRTELPYVAFVMLASTVFVCWHVPIYILIMLTTLVVDFVAAFLIYRSPAGAFRRKVLLAVSMATNLALLGFFKYANFFLEQFHELQGYFNVKADEPHYFKFLLPMGISFYTFGSMSYTIDVYRGRLKPVRTFADFYYFLTFFPHMVAGPIIRAEQFFYQMWRRRPLRLRTFNEGGYQIIRGLFLKMVCADNISSAVNNHWKEGYKANAPSAQLFVLAALFAAQIFCDFEGYSSIARGLAYWLGYRFPLNFNNPYIAGSFSNFWERWHITLSRWLRDYLYIPLGGNRGSAVRTYFNLMIVMLLGGLWHGAAMTFVIWGAIHGVSLAVERMLGLGRPTGFRASFAIRSVWFLVVQFVVMIAWVFFRSDTYADAHTFIANMFQFSGLELHLGDESALVKIMVTKPVAWACLYLIPVLLMHIHGWLVERRLLSPLGRIAQGVMAAVMLFAIMSCYGQSSEFIYFRF